MKRLALSILMVTAVTGFVERLAAQAAEINGQVRFEAASVRRSTMPGRRSMAVTPEGISYQNVTLADCLVAAFGIERYQIDGPDWLSTERYTIAARTAAPSAVSRVMRMLQELLAERFTLATRWKQRELLVYVLRLANGTPKLKPAEARGGVIPAAGGMTFLGMTMQEFTDEFLSHLPSMDRIIINATELDGRFDFTLRVFDHDPAPGELKPAVLAGGPDLFIHALEQVGLKLTRETRAVDVLVIDRADRIPLEN